MSRTSADRGRALLWQAALVLALAAMIGLGARQTAANLKARGIASGWDYLDRAAGFEVARGPLSYSSRDSYGRALAVGVVNTLRVSALAALLATAIGAAIGIGRLSRVRVVSTACAWYVEILRNTPLLLQLLFWYALSQRLPDTRAAWSIGRLLFLSQRGLFLPRLAWLDGGLHLDLPVLGRFDFDGGLGISPEFAVLLFGLSTYTAAFIAEIVRGGVLAVDQGQSEAAAALGLSRGRILRLVVVPQALPMILPPLVTQFVNVAKNSSLAVAIGYPDLMSITSTTLNQTGQAIEAVAVATAIYLTISLVVSVIVSRHVPGVHGV